MSKWTPAKDFWKRRGLPEPQVEYVFHPSRKWRFDFAWTMMDAAKGYIALEVEGGTWMRGGGHNRGSGMERDMNKYNMATRMGWRIYRVTPQQLENDRPINTYSKKYRGVKDGETVSQFLRSILTPPKEPA